MNYNNRYTKRWNDFIRTVFILPRLRNKIKNKDFTLLANNCNGGFIYHDLGLQFKSPTINLFFYYDHFFTFLEHLEEYIAEEIRPCTAPCHKPEIDYPVCNIGGDNTLPLIELHFLHYHSMAEAHDTWESRKRRIAWDNLFAIFSFNDDTDEVWLKRFDAIPIKNKIAFVNRPFPQYKSACYIAGYEQSGLGQLGEYDNLWGRRKYDHFDFVEWLNNH